MCTSPILWNPMGVVFTDILFYPAKFPSKWDHHFVNAVAFFRASLQTLLTKLIQPWPNFPQFILFSLIICSLIVCKMYQPQDVQHFVSRHYICDWSIPVFFFKVASQAKHFMQTHFEKHAHYHLHVVCGDVDALACLCCGVHVGLISNNLKHFNRNISFEVFIRSFNILRCLWSAL